MPVYQWSTEGVLWPAVLAVLSARGPSLSTRCYLRCQCGRSFALVLNAHGDRDYCRLALRFALEIAAPVLECCSALDEHKRLRLVRGAGPRIRTLSRHQPPGRHPQSAG